MIENKSFTFREYKHDDSRKGRLTIRWEHANGIYHQNNLYEMDSGLARKLFRLIEILIHALKDDKY